MSLQFCPRGPSQDGIWHPTAGLPAPFRRLRPGESPLPLPLPQVGGNSALQAPRLRASSCLQVPNRLKGKVRAEPVSWGVLCLSVFPPQSQPWTWGASASSEVDGGQCVPAQPELVHQGSSDPRQGNRWPEARARPEGLITATSSWVWARQVLLRWLLSWKPVPAGTATTVELS